MTKAVAVQSKNVVVEKSYNGMNFKFREDGYFNMTHACKHFGKDLQVFMRRADTVEYIEELSSLVSDTNLTKLGVVDMIPGNRYIEDRGRWAHPKLAVFFARWLDVKFAVFCDMVIDDLMHGHSVITVVNPEKAIAPTLPKSYIESLQELIESLKEQDRLKLEVEQKQVLIVKQETKLIEQAPKVDFFDKYVEADGALGIQTASKLLRMNMRELGHWLVDKRLCFRRQPMNTLSPYATATTIPTTFMIVHLDCGGTRFSYNCL